MKSYGYKSFKKEAHSRGEKGFRDITRAQNKRVRARNKRLLALRMRDETIELNVVLGAVDLL